MQFRKETEMEQYLPLLIILGAALFLLVVRPVMGGG